MKTLTIEKEIWTILELKEVKPKLYREIIERHKEDSIYLDMIREDFRHYLNEWIGEEGSRQITQADKWDLSRYANYSVNWDFKVSHRQLLNVLLKQGFKVSDQFCNYVIDTLQDRGVYVNYYKSGMVENIILCYYDNWDNTDDIKKEFNNPPISIVLECLETGADLFEILDGLSDPEWIQATLEDFYINCWQFLHKQYEAFTADEYIEEQIASEDLEFDDEGNVY